MRYGTLDTRSLAVYSVNVAAKTFYNPTTGSWDAVLTAANLVPLVGGFPPLGPSATLITAQTGSVGERTDVVTVVCTTSTNTVGALVWVADVSVVMGPPSELAVQLAQIR